MLEGVVSFGQLLRDLRTGAGLTQEELAQAAALSTRAVSDLERGISLTARKDTARLLADALNLSGPARAGFEAAARGRPAPDGVAAATRTLPRDVAAFTDRGDELRQVAAAAGPGGIFTIGGMAGVGKTAFAVRAAHQMAPLFPDGQIYLPLHAHAAGRLPVRPADALASLLQTIGIPPARIPPGLEARTGLWRDRLAGRQLLLLLDDAAGTDQIRPLIPGTGGILVLITSRTHLTALEDARVISLDILPPRDACGLLARLATRPGLEAADPAVAEIARLCGRLPLALGMVARQLCHHPSWSPAAVAADLASARDRLDLLHAENLSVAAAFDRSYQDLSASAQRMFRLLGLHPGSDFDAPAAAALGGTSLARARTDLEGLYDRYLLSEITQGRYRFHELIREHARSLVLASPSQEREEVMTRLLDYYLQAVCDAARSMHSGGEHLGPETPAAADAGVPGGREEAVSWMAAERLNLHAAARHAAAAGQPRYAFAIPAAMHEFLRDQGYWQQALALHHLAADAARQAGSLPAEASALIRLGEMQFLTDDYSAATASLARALDLFRGLGDRAGQAGALTGLGTLQEATADSHAAAATLTTALSLYRDLGDEAGQAAALTGLGTVQHAAGDSTTAAATFTTALSLYRDLGDLPGQASALTGLGAAHLALGNHPNAIASYQQALTICRRLGDKPGEADALTGLGTTQSHAGHHRDARASHARALALYRDLGDQSGEAQTLNNLADTLRLCSQPAQARLRYEQALAVSARIAAPGQQARALEGTGLCHLSEGNPRQGRELLRQAAALYMRIGSTRGHDIELLLSSPLAATSDHRPASPAQ